VFFDDILCSGNSLEEHDHVVELFIKRAKSLGIKFNKDKLQYRVDEVKYIGQMFSGDGMRPDPERVRALINLPVPSSKKELQGVLGMFNYVRNYIPNGEHRVPMASKS